VPSGVGSGEGRSARRTEWPLAGLALVFLAADSVEVLRNEIRELRQGLLESGMI
jgi:hypothetical protein